MSKPEVSMRGRLVELVTVFLGVALAFLADDFRERLELPPFSGRVRAWDSSGIEVKVLEVDG